MATTPVAADVNLLCCLGPSLGATGPARIARIAAELADGFNQLRGLTRAVSVFGSARVSADHPDWGLARRTAAALGRAGFAIITGGGSGITAAANCVARSNPSPPTGS